MIEIQLSSFDVIKKQQQTENAIKLQQEAFTSGLVAKLKPTNFTVFLTLCSFMDASGKCCPSQRDIAERSGLSKTTVNKAINELLEFELNGQPILYRELSGQSAYTVMPAAKEESKETEVAAAATMFSSGVDILKYFAGIYRDVYGVNPKISWGVDSAIVKKAWIGTYSDEDIKTMIDFSVKEYDSRWKNSKYPRPTIRGIVSWIGPTALALETDAKKELEEITALTGNEEEIEQATMLSLQNRLKRVEANV